MKSIYEASVAYGREHQGTVNIEDYQAGANAVLEEIENFAEINFSDYLEPIKLLREKIKKLKG